MQVVCNGVDYAKSAQPGSYIAIDRQWSKGDVVEVKTPMTVKIEELPNVPNAISIMRGPILLGARTGTENMPGLIAGDGRWEHIAHGSLVSLFDAPYIIGERSDILNKLNNMRPVEGKSFSFTVPDLFTQEKYKNLILEPFYGIHDSRYMMYWLSMSEPAFREYKQAVEAEERGRMILDKRTVDMVSSGEQQPESDHAMKTQDSHRGVHAGEAWRDARNGGYFEYTLTTKGNENLSLMVRYWGAESGSRSFDILVDGQTIATENIVGKWKKDLFCNVEYNIPATLLKSKDKITVRFQSKPDTTAGGILQYDCWFPNQW